MFNLLDTVKLKNEKKEIGLLKGTVGAVIDVLNNGKAYSVEFFDDKNETIEQSIFEYFGENELELVKTFKD